MYIFETLNNLFNGGIIMGNSSRFYADIMSMHREVTGSCNLVVVKLPNRETIWFVVDCGLFQEKDLAQQTLQTEMMCYMTQIRK